MRIIKANLNNVPHHRYPQQTAVQIFWQNLNLREIPRQAFCGERARYRSSPAIPAKSECECSSTQVDGFIDLTCRGERAVDIEETELVNGSVWEDYHGVRIVR